VAWWQWGWPCSQYLRGAAQGQQQLLLQQLLLRLPLR
jgi:hypothetical protein